jgi:hypothetical protein
MPSEGVFLEEREGRATENKGAAKGRCADVIEDFVYSRTRHSGRLLPRTVEMDVERLTEIGVVANRSQGRRGGVRVAVPEWIAALPGGVHGQLKGYGRCQVSGGDIEIRGRMKGADEALRCRWDLPVRFVVSGEIPLIQYCIFG